MKCPRCQQQNPSNAKFCLACASPIDGVPLQKSYADLKGEIDRLKGETEELRRSLSEASEQQMATSEILKAISGAQTDINSVFDAIARSAVKLCGAFACRVFRAEDELLPVVGEAYGTPDARALFHGTHPEAVGRDSPSAIAVRERRVVQYADVPNDPDVPERYRARARARGYRALMAVPMVRDQVVFGTITVVRQEPVPFSEQQVELVKTFADQAVIAIENVRLFTELQEKNRALTQAHAQVSEALEQRTATADILRVIASSPIHVGPVFDAILRAATRLCGACFGGVYRYDGRDVHLASHYNITEPGLQMLERILPHEPTIDGSIGRAILSRSVVHVTDLRDPQAPRSDVIFSRIQPHCSVLAVPMLREGMTLGVIALSRGELPFSDRHIALLQTFADQAVIAIENVRLFTELQQKNGALTEALEQQTATSDILRVISSSPTDVQPVFEAIAENAARLVQAWSVTVLRWDGRLIHLVAERGGPPGSGQRLRDESPWLPNTTSGPGRCIATGTIIHVPDVDLDPEADAATRELARKRGWRSDLNVPMLREGSPIGAISVTHVEAGPFSPAEIELLRTFADQAVIAIENVRLFNELEAANRNLKAASQHKSEFLANMSHELRTPLNAIIGFSEVLGERLFGELNEKQAEYLKDIYASGQHLLSLINDILDLSKIEAGRMELEVADFHLPQAIENALVLVRERALRRGITLEQAIDSRLGEIRGDERKVKQVMLNLLSNAVKFTPDGGRINVQAVARDASVEVSVSDTGVGIAPANQEAIFEEFRQVGTAAKKVEGTGLGLTLSRKFIELHGGRIWVESQLGTGSTFTFTIPVRCGE